MDIYLPDGTIEWRNPEHYGIPGIEFEIQGGTLVIFAVQAQIGGDLVYRQAREAFAPGTWARVELRYVPYE